MHLAQRLLLPPCFTSHLTTFNFIFYFCASSPSLLRSACKMVTSFWVLTTALISLSPANSMISHVWIINKKHYRVPAQMKILVRFDSFPALQNIHDSNDLCTRPDTKKRRKKKKRNAVMPALVSFYIDGQRCTKAFSLAGQKNSLLITGCCSHGGLFQLRAFI